VEARYSRKKSTAWTGYKVHFTERCARGAPHLIVEVTPTSATAADGDIVGALQERLAEHQVLPQEHVMDRGYVDAGVLAESQER
jgi:transposase